MEKELNVNISPNKLLKVEHVAERLSISRALAYRLMQTGVIPTIRFGRTVRVREMDLEDFILTHRSG